MHIGIIGFGNFGQFLGGRFAREGHKVSAWSRDDVSVQAKELGVEFFPQVADLCDAGCDVMILSMSILSFAEVVQALPLEKLGGCLIVDVLSVKAYPKEFLRRVLPNACDILCTHPMFGPDSGKGVWDGLPFMFEKVRIRNQAVCEEFLNFFSSQGCEMMEMSCEKHDMYAASSQFVTHTTGRILDKLELKETPVNTKGYEQLLKLVENTVHDSFDLYFGLYSYNPSARDQLTRLEDALREVKNSLFERARQQRQTTVIGIQGGNGSFNHAAALELIEKYGIKHPEISFLITSEAVLGALNNGEVDFGVFAIENSASGTVLPSIYSMSKYPHEIIEVHDMPLVQCLLVRPGQDIGAAKKIVTHPQAIKQCAHTIRDKFPWLSSDYLSDDYDTAACAKQLAEGLLPADTVVIASKIAAVKYGLEIAYEGLNDDKDNYTSFVFCKRRGS